MEQRLAAGTLDQLTDVRRSARTDLQAFWFPLVVFGSLTILSAGVVVAAGVEALSAYWPLAGVAGGALTSWHYHRREQRLGLQGPAAPYIATAGAILVGAMLAGALGSRVGPGLAGAVGPALVVAAGLAAVLLALGVAVALWGPDVEAATVVLAVSSGAVLLATGLAQRWSTGGNP